MRYTISPGDQPVDATVSLTPDKEGKVAARIDFAGGAYHHVRYGHEEGEVIIGLPAPTLRQYTECLPAPHAARVAGGPHRGPDPVQSQPANRVRAGRQQR